MKSPEVIISELLDAAGVVYSGISESVIVGTKVLTIDTDDTSALIGSRGDTLYAIDLLVKKIAESNMDSIGDIEHDSEKHPFPIIDVGGYRVQKIKDLEMKANMLANRAREFKYDVEMEPMSSYERLIVHTVLSGVENIKTESHGEGRARRIVIRYISA